MLRWAKQTISNAFTTPARKRASAPFEALPKRLPRFPQHRAQDVVLGLMIGDSLGATTEFMRAGSAVARVCVPDMEHDKGKRGFPGEIVGGGLLGWARGAPTDDSAMALEVVQALVSQNGYLDPLVAAERELSHAEWLDGRATRLTPAVWLAWAQSRPPDIGKTVSDAMREYGGGSHPRWHMLSDMGGRPLHMANGSLMRNGVIPALAADWEQEALTLSLMCGSVTHPQVAPTLCCLLHTSLIWRALCDGGPGSLAETVATPTSLGTPSAREVTGALIEWLLCAPEGPIQSWAAHVEELGSWRVPFTVSSRSTRFPGEPLLSKGWKDDPAFESTDEGRDESSDAVEALKARQQPNHAWHRHTQTFFLPSFHQWCSQWLQMAGGREAFARAAKDLARYLGDFADGDWLGPPVLGGNSAGELPKCLFLSNQTLKIALWNLHWSAQDPDRLPPPVSSSLDEEHKRGLQGRPVWPLRLRGMRSLALSALVGFDSDTYGSTAGALLGAFHPGGTGYPELYEDRLLARERAATLLARLYAARASPDR
jgi:ADP-ribosylglycohydrolase